MAFDGEVSIPLPLPPRRYGRRRFMRRAVRLAVGTVSLLACARPGPAPDQPQSDATADADAIRPSGDAASTPLLERTAALGGADPTAPPARVGPVPQATSDRASPGVPGPGPVASPVVRQAPARTPAVSEAVVGAIYPFSGPVGSAVQHALRTVIDMANTRTEGLPWPWAVADGLPGLGGARVRLVVADDEGRPEAGVEAAERLIAQEKVHAVVGCLTNATTAAVSRVCERAAIPFLAPEAPASTLHARGLEWFFRTGPHDGQVTESMFRFMDEYRKRVGIGLNTLGLTYEDTLFGEESGRTQKELALKYGYQVLVDSKYRSRSASLATEVQQLKAANPDVWLPTSYQADAILFARTARQLDYNPTMVLAQGYGHTDPSFVRAVGGDAEGVISRAAFSIEMQEKRPLVRTVNELYRRAAVAAGGRAEDLDEVAALALTGMLVLVDVLNRAGSVQPAAIRRALQQTSIPAEWLIVPWRGVRFEANGQNDQAGALMMQLRGGRYTVVWPFELGAKGVLYPIPPWSQRR